LWNPSLLPTATFRFDSRTWSVTRQPADGRDANSRATRYREHRDPALPGRADQGSPGRAFVPVRQVAPRRADMKPPWTTQLASDVVRDGLGLELLDTPYRVVAEVFRCDADHTVTIRQFEDGIPADVLDDFVRDARERLGPFEDGSPLPVTFAVERAV